MLKVDYATRLWIATELADDQHLFKHVLMGLEWKAVNLSGIGTTYEAQLGRKRLRVFVCRRPRLVS